MGQNFGCFYETYILCCQSIVIMCRFPNIYIINYLVKI